MRNSRKKRVCSLKCLHRVAWCCGKTLPHPHRQEAPFSLRSLPWQMLPTSSLLLWKVTSALHSFDAPGVLSTTFSAMLRKESQHVAAGGSTSACRAWPLSLSDSEVIATEPRRVLRKFVLFAYEVVVLFINTMRQAPVHGLWCHSIPKF